MTFLLDTDICVFWLRGRASVQEHLTKVGPSAVAISIVTLAELRYGASCSLRPEANHQAIDAFISGIAVLSLDLASVQRFGDIKATLRQQGTLLEDFDLLIAATPQTYGLMLVTNNIAHFRRIPGLQLETWA